MLNMEFVCGILVRIFLVIARTIELHPVIQVEPFLNIIRWQELDFGQKLSAVHKRIFPVLEFDGDNDIDHDRRHGADFVHRGVMAVSHQRLDDEWIADAFVTVSFIMF